MFSKKPFAGLACASCEKDMTNMYGRRVEYMPWSKLPTRDPAERIAKVGQGFSKMLSMIKPESMTQLDTSRNSPGKLPSVVRESYDPRLMRRLGAQNQSVTIQYDDERPLSGKAQQLLSARK